VTDTACDHIAQLTQLTRINIACTDCSARTAVALTKLPRLREVGICGPAEWHNAGGGGGGGGAAQPGTLNSSSSHHDWEGAGHDEGRKGLQGVPAVLALVPCAKLKCVVLPEAVLKDARRSLEGRGGHVPAWMWGDGQACVAPDIWKHDMV
jgi:hypothetical protein